MMVSAPSKTLMDSFSRLVPSIVAFTDPVITLLTPEGDSCEGLDSSRYRSGASDRRRCVQYRLNIDAVIADGSRDAESVVAGISVEVGIGEVRALIDALVVLVHGRPVERIVSGTTRENIDSEAAGDGIVSDAAGDHIIADISRDAIAAAAIDPVVAVAAADGILPGSSRSHHSLPHP